MFVQEIEALRASTSRLEERLTDEKEGRKIAEGQISILKIFKLDKSDLFSVHERCQIFFFVFIFFIFTFFVMVLMMTV